MKQLIFIFALIVVGCSSDKHRQPQEQPKKPMLSFDQVEHNLDSLAKVAGLEKKTNEFERKYTYRSVISADYVNTPSIYLYILVFPETKGMILPRFFGQWVKVDVD